MKYLLKQNKEDKGILCDKITIDGFDYYIEDGKVIKPIDFSKWQYSKNANMIFIGEPNILKGEYYEVIATNNPNIDLPKVVDEVKLLAKQNGFDWENTETSARRVFEKWHKSQETHPFSGDDMIAFAEWLSKINYGQLEYFDGSNLKPFKYLLQIWGEQHPKVIYYNGCDGVIKKDSTGKYFSENADFVIKYERPKNQDNNILK